MVRGLLITLFYGSLDQFGTKHGYDIRNQTGLQLETELTPLMTWHRVTVGGGGGALGLMTLFHERLVRYDPVCSSLWYQKQPDLRR